MASLATPTTYLKHREGRMTDKMCPDSRPRHHESIHRTCSDYLLWALSVPSQEAGAPSVFLHECLTSVLFGRPHTMHGRTSLREANRQDSHCGFRSHALGQGLWPHAVLEGGGA